jgi:hypothetical protein
MNHSADPASLAPYVVPLRAIVVMIVDPAMVSAERVSDLAPAMAMVRKNR